MVFHIRSGTSVVDVLSSIIKQCHYKYDVLISDTHGHVE